LGYEAAGLDIDDPADDLVAASHATAASVARGGLAEFGNLEGFVKLSLRNVVTVVSGLDGRLPQPPPLPRSQATDSLDAACIRSNLHQHLACFQ